jgi:hypothetical protein
MRAKGERVPPNLPCEVVPSGKLIDLSLGW